MKNETSQFPAEKDTKVSILKITLALMFLCFTRYRRENQTGDLWEEKLKFTRPSIYPSSI